MKKFLTVVFILFVAYANAQTFWYEDFGTGCNQGTVATSYSGLNGSWTIASTGTNDPYADVWYISATANNNGEGNCADGCGTNPTLHIGNADLSSLGVEADASATYLTGLFCSLDICSTTHWRVESPTINCTGQSNISATFFYLEGGEAADDDARFWYFDGTNWSELDQLAKTTTCGTASGIWTAFNISLPSSANNNPNVKIGFNWTNDNDAVGVDPSFAIDDIKVYTSACSITITQTNVSCFGFCDGSLQAIGNGASPFTYTWSDGSNGDILIGLCPGEYTVVMSDADGCSATAVATITEPAELLTSDTTVNASCATCADGSATASVSGGTAPYSILWSNSQTDMTIDSLVPGSYAYTISDGNGCTYSDSVNVQFATGFAQLQNHHNFYFSPNPFNESTLLSMDNVIGEKYELVIYDMVGNVVCTYQISTKAFILSKGMLAAGMYNCKLTDDKNHVYHTKLIVQ